MRNLFLLPVLLIVLVLNILPSSQIQAATINAASCSQVDVQNAVNTASEGDTVLVPSGSCSWNSSLSILKGITLKGVGSGSARPIITITHSGNFAISLQATDGKLIRVSNFIFRDTGSPITTIQVNGASNTPSWRVDNNRFEDIADRVIVVRDQGGGSSGLGPYGLVDNNWFESAGSAYRGLYLHSSSQEWITPMSFGTDKTIVIEDNVFNKTGGTVPGLPAIDSTNGARWNFRHNTLNNWVAVLHGADSASVSTLQFEFNHNTIRVNDPVDYALYIRGGTGVAMGNDVGYAGNANNAGYNSAFKMVRDGPCAGGYPCYQQVGRGVVNNAEGSVPVYLWNNIYNPGDCCNGDLYSTVSDVQLSRDFFLSSKSSYTELAYPHPLRSGDIPLPPPDTTQPSVPTNLSATAVSSSQINLSWTASTDNVGVVGYRVYRGGVQIATVTSGTTYSDTGLSPQTTYSYTVAAYDAAGNVSAQSSAVSAITQSVGGINCDFTTLQAAVSTAQRGATITCNAGNWTWSGTLTLTKGIILKGAGRDSMFITGGNTFIVISPDATAIANEERIEVTGFTLDGNNSALTHIQVNGPSSPKPFKNLVIGNMRFKNSSANAAISTNGQIRGVIYGNIFDRVNLAAKIMGNDTFDPEWATFGPSRAFGTADNLYFEDNTIQYSSSYGGSDPGWTESGHSGRFIVRYNSWNMVNASTPQEVWDIHGSQYNPGGQAGTMISEYYGNTIIDARHYRWIYMRGGWGLFFNNLAAGTGGLSIQNSDYDGSCDSITGYPTQIDNTYYWNNTRNGNMVSSSVLQNNCAGTKPLTENVRFWNYSSSCTEASCSAGVGRGTSVPTGTCTPGVGFWVASMPTPTTNSSVIQSGILYKCTATNTWTVYYTPYQYPHPLRSATADTTPPTTPTGLTVI